MTVKKHTVGPILRISVHVLTPYPVLRTQLFEHIVTRDLKTSTYPSTVVNSENVPVPSDLELVGYHVIYHLRIAR